MLEIIPNWHPVLVHFTIGLFATATGLFCLGTVFIQKSWGETVLKAAHINLWIGAAITVLTLLAGWNAYNAVTHDTASHLAMTDHRNWAFVTAGLYFIATFWSLSTYKKTAKVKILFLILLVTAFGLLATTGYKGGEVVYRYGIGVMSMPVPSEDGSHASHEHETPTKEAKEPQDQMQKTTGSDIIEAERDTHDDHSTHEHGAPKKEVKTND